MPILFKRVVAAATCFFYLYSSSLPAWADAVTQSAAEGNQVARDAMSGFSAPRLENNEIIFGSGQGSSNIRVQDLFPGVTSTVDPDLENAFGNDERTLERGTEANARLSTETTMEGDAYRLLKGTSKLIRPNIKNDPLWSNTDKVIDNQNMFEEEFADCKETNTVTPTTVTKRIPEYKTCERVNKPAGNCDINHYVEIETEPTDMFFLVDNSASMDAVIRSLRENVYRVADLLGAKNKNQLRLGGAVTRGSQYTGNHIKLTYDIDAFQSWINNVTIDGGQTYTFNAVHWAAANNDWRDNVNRVLVIIGNQDNGNGSNPKSVISSMGFQVYVFHDNSEIRSLGVPIANTFTAGGLFRVAQFLTVVRDRWETAECVQAARSTLDGFCTGSYSVTSGGTECVNLSGFDVCPGDPIYSKLSEPPIPNVSKLALKVSVGAVSCPFNEGQMECYTDAQGVEQCPENNPNSCAVTHSFNIQEMPMVAKVAVEDTIDAHENNRVVFDFINGTYVNTSRQTRIDGQVSKVNFGEYCKADSSGKLIPHKFSLASTSIWLDHKFAPNTLATASVNVVQAPSCENGLQMVVDITDTAKGELNKFYAHEFSFKLLRLTAEQWGPEHCIKAAQNVASGSCAAGKLTVTKGVSSGCLPYKGTNICPGDPIYNAMLPSPIPGIDKLAQSVRVEGCVDNSMRSSTCEDFEEKGCGFISTQCVGKATGASGYCYVQEEVWDCGINTEVPSASLETSYQCDGPVRCLGTECYNPVDEKSSDFAYAAASLQIAQFAEHDMDCGENPEGNLDCKIWKGEMFECKKAVGGWVDCCEEPDGVSLMDYMNLTMNTMKAANFLGAFGEVAQKEGLFTYGTQLVSQGITAVASNTPWVSAGEALSGQVLKLGQSALLDQFKQQLINQVAEWTLQVFGEAAAGALFSVAGSAASAGGEAAFTSGSNAALSSAVAGILSGVMMVYMIYQIVNILVQIIWECEEREFELGAKKATKLCHFVGSYCASDTPFGCIEKRESYCCFNSPLGRIIQQQARPQLGQEWGEPESPDCGGLNVEDLGKLDWSKIDISEWIGILNITGNYPTINGMNLDDLTGPDSTLSLGGTRQNTLDRNIERAKDIPFPDARKEIEDGVRNGLQ